MSQVRIKFNLWHTKGEHIIKCMCSSRTKFIYFLFLLKSCFMDQIIFFEGRSLPTLNYYTVRDFSTRIFDAYQAHLAFSYRIIFKRLFRSPFLIIWLKFRVVCLLMTKVMYEILCLFVRQNSRIVKSKVILFVLLTTIARLLWNIKQTGASYVFF